MNPDHAGTAYLIMGLFAYFIPALIALKRGHHQKLAIFMTDLLLGWTFIGWAVALIWACTAITKPYAIER